MNIGKRVDSLKPKNKELKLKDKLTMATFIQIGKYKLEIKLKMMIVNTMIGLKRLILAIMVSRKNVRTVVSICSITAILAKSAGLESVTHADGIEIFMVKVQGKMSLVMMILMKNQVKSLMMIQISLMVMNNPMNLIEI